MSKAEDIIGEVITATEGFSKRERCVAGLTMLEHAGIPLALIRKIGDLLYPEIDDFDDCELPGESDEECCARVAREERLLREQLHLNWELE